MLFGVNRRYNTVADTNFNFSTVQNIRIFLIAALVILLFFCVFVIAKLMIVYFICWSILFMLMAEVMLSCAAGRQKVELKMLEKKIQADLLANKLIKAPKLAPEDRSKYWKTAVRLYSIAIPFYFMCLILFYYPKMQYDISCELVYLKCTADAKN